MHRFFVVSFESVFTMTLLCSVLILVLCFLFKNERVINKLGPGCMIGILLAVVIRMFFPLEFLYTYKLAVKDILWLLCSVLFYVIVSEPFKIMVWHVLVGIWMTGILLRCIQLFIQHRKMKRIVAALQETTLYDLCEQNGLQTEEYPGMEKVRIFLSEVQSSPFLVGVIHPCMILPKMVYEKEQLHFIILHEFMHVKKRDVVWKTLIDVLCTVFWWNPVMHYLKKQLFQLVEMRNDEQITANLSSEDYIAYMRCLKDTAVQLAGKDIAFGVSFYSGQTELQRRIKRLCGDQKESKGVQILSGTAICVVLFLTTTVAITADNISITTKRLLEEEGLSEYEEVSEKNTFLIKNGDEYDAYVDGEYLYTTEDVGIYFNNARFYDSLEEAREENRFD